MESYLAERIFKVVHDEAKSDYHPIAASMPQESLLAPLLYLLYTADIPPTAGNEMTTFADDTVITAVSESQQIATYSLQQAINSVNKWAQQFPILSKPPTLLFALRNRDLHPRMYINDVQIQQKKSAKYLDS